MRPADQINGFESPLRPSLFDGVPPFINYVPNQIFGDLKEKPPQYWDFNKVRIQEYSDLVYNVID